MMETGVEANILMSRLERLLADSGVDLTSLTPSRGLDLMIRLYEADPSDKHLNFYWGWVTRYGAEEMGFTFQCEFAPDRFPVDGRVNLLFKIGFRPLAGDFGNEMFWCDALEDLATFRSSVESSPSFKVWGRKPAAGVALDDGALWPPKLIDCWGARDPSRPIVSMTEEEWLVSDDVSRMLRWFRQEWRGEERERDWILTRYHLACARRIWKLLPLAESRAAVEVGERNVSAGESLGETGDTEWEAEGAAFLFDPDCGASESEKVARCLADVARIPPAEIAAMLHPGQAAEADLSPLNLLRQAANFAHLALCGGLYPPEGMDRYLLFMPASLLREIVGNPFRANQGPGDRD